MNSICRGKPEPVLGLKKLSLLPLYPTVLVICPKDGPPKMSKLPGSPSGVWLRALNASARTSIESFSVRRTVFCRAKSICQTLGARIRPRPALPKVPSAGTTKGPTGASVNAVRRELVLLVDPVIGVLIGRNQGPTRHE